MCCDRDLTRSFYVGTQNIIIIILYYHTFDIVLLLLVLVGAFTPLVSWLCDQCALIPS